MIMERKKLIIKPFNSVYIAFAAGVLVITSLICLCMNALSAEQSQAVVLYFSAFMCTFMFIYKAALLFDREYAEIVYPGEKMNVWNELIFFPCNVIAMIAFSGILLRSRLLMSFAFFYAVCPVIALLVPPAGYEKYSLTIPRVWAFYCYHYMIIMNVVLMLKSGIYIPEYTGILPACLLYAGISFFFLLVNDLMIFAGVNKSANYFFNRIPEKNIILETLYKIIPVPYLFTVPLIAAGGILDILIVFVVRLLV